MPVSGSMISSLRYRARPSFSLNRSCQGSSAVLMAIICASTGASRSLVRLVPFGDLQACLLHDALNRDRLAAGVLAFLGGDHEGNEVDGFLGGHRRFTGSEKGANRPDESLVVPALTVGCSQLAGDPDQLLALAECPN